MKAVLLYIGDGGYWPGVPACDLTQDMIDATGLSVDELLALRSGGLPLYVAPQDNEEVSNGE